MCVCVCITTYLLLVVQTLVVVLEDRHALCLARVVFGIGVGHVAGEDFLPEGEAARGACAWVLVSSYAGGGVVLCCVGVEVRWRRSGEGKGKRVRG